MKFGPPPCFGKISFGALIAAMCAFGAEAAEWSGKVTLTEDVTEPVTLDGEVEVTVASGSTVTISGAISDKAGTQGKIKLLGGGTLALAAANDFTGGAYIEEGVLDVKTGGALGTGDIIVKGGTTAISQLRFADMDYGQDQKTITFSNAITIENGGDASHYQLQFGPHGVKNCRQSIKFAGPVVCNGDLYFKIDPKSEFSSVAGNLSFEFAGGLTANKLITDRSTVAGTFSSPIDAEEISFGNSGRAAFAFASTENHIGKISTYQGLIDTQVIDALGGAALQFRYAKDTSACNLSMYGCNQTIAWVANQPVSQGEYLYSGITKSAVATLTITGGVESACFYGFLTNRMSSAAYKMHLTLDAGNEDFVQAFSNNVHCIRGDITVKNGTLLFGGATSLTNVPTINVEGGLFKLDTTLDDPLQSLTTVNLGTAGRIDLGARMVMLDTLTVGGEDVYMATHANYPEQIAEGTVLVRKEVPVGMSYTAVDMTALGDWEIEVPAKSTNVVTVAQTGAGRITKKGTGYLLFQTANDFSGGVQIDAGVVVVGHDGALGSGPVGIAGSTTAACQLRIDTTLIQKKTTIVNAITLQGDSASAHPALYFMLPATTGVDTPWTVTFTGGVAANGDLWIGDNHPVETLWQGKKLYEFDCPVNAGAHDVRFVRRASMCGDVYFSGKLTAKELYFAGYKANGSNSAGRMHLGQENEIGSVSAAYNLLYLDEDNALGDADVYISESFSGALSQFLLQGRDQHVRSLSSVKSKGPNESDIVMSNSGTMATVTIDGDTDSSGKTSQIRMTGTLSLVLDAKSDDFVQTIANRYHTMSGPITVKRGMLKLAGTSTFKSVPSIEIMTGGALEVSTTEVDCFSSVMTLAVSNGATFRVTSGVQNLFSDNYLTMYLESGATIEFADATTLTIDVLYVDGKGYSARATPYTSADFPMLPSTLSINVTGQAPVVKEDVTWQGPEEGDFSIKTAANWGRDTAPDFVNESGYHPIFAASGERAEVSEAVRFNGITFAPQTSTAGFTIAATDPAAAIELGAETIVLPDEAEPSETTHEYVIEPHVTMSNEAEWTVATNDTLALLGGLDVGKPIAVTGDGRFVLGGESTLPNADFDAFRQLFTGTIRNPDGSIGGITSSTTDEGSLVLHMCLPSFGYLNCFSNAVIEKSVVFAYGTRATTTGSYAFQVEPGSTNIFKGGIRMHQPWMYMNLCAGSETIFEGGYSAAWTQKLRGSGRLVVRKKPMRVYASSSQNTCFEMTESSRLRLETTGCEFNYLRLSGSGNGVEFAVDNCCTNTPLQMNNNSANCRANLLSTRQEFKFLSSTANSIVTGDAGSELTIVKGHQDEAAATATNALGAITGQLSLVMAGEGVQQIAGACTSTGDLTAANGVLLLTGSWLNGTNFTARGTGTLKFAKKGQVDRHFARLHLADEGKIEIPEGVTLQFASADVNGVPVEAGVYTAADLKEGDPLYGRLVGGTLCVGPLGVMILVW